MKWGTWLRAEWDRVAGFGLIGLGALFVLLGYLGVRNTPFVAEQMAYMASGGIGGLFCLGFGVGLLLSADLHDEWRKLDRIEAELRGDVLPEPDAGMLPPADLSHIAESGTDSAALPAPGNGQHRPESVRHPASTPGGFGVDSPHPAGTAGAFAVDPAHPAGTAGAFAVDPAHPAGTAVTVPLNLSHPAGGTRRALAFLSLALLLPFAVAGAGWRRASQTADMDVAGRGLGWAVAAVALAFILIAVWGLWMRVSVLRRRAMVTRAVRRWNRNRFAGSGATTTSGSAGAGVGAGDDVVFVASGHPRYHQAGCPTLEWIDAVAVSRDGVDARLSACGLCQAP